MSKSSDEKMQMWLRVQFATGAEKQKGLDFFAELGMTEQDVLNTYGKPTKGYLDVYLFNHDSSRYQVAHDKNNPNMSEQTLYRAANVTDFKYINLRVVFAVANTLGKTPGTVLDDLVKIEESDRELERMLKEDEIKYAKEDKATIKAIEEAAENEKYSK
ncbi:hypothetical protein GPK34_00325 [Secundilactobacillus kimchicus]|uniref:hypothetical protein n=1 Tax=Secundilactobacillus kimchicus TaxID=528209 RepID=UPI001C037682|nr:hypothetical protein [Secundilactobacillus kimchicus]MBT9670482.1 hypothetical protein [Secundilactobacillus kimchicus]